MNGRYFVDINEVSQFFGSKNWANHPEGRFTPSEMEKKLKKIGDETINIKKNFRFGFAFSRYEWALKSWS